MIISPLVFISLASLFVISIMILLSRNLLFSSLVFSLFSLFCAFFYIASLAVDVAITEIAIGAGASSILMLLTLSKVGIDEKISANISRQEKQKKYITLAFLIIIGLFICVSLMDMPPFMELSNPSNLHVANRYIEETPTNYKIPNIVTAVLGSYRGYDTMGETTVILIAAVGVFTLLRSKKSDKEIIVSEDLTNSAILLRGAQILIPVIMLFASYILFHGDLSPGGGFQAGVIFANAYILFALIFGLDKAIKYISFFALELMLSIGVLLYVGTGFITFLIGGSFLEYNVLAHQAFEGQHYGLFLIELGVFFTVFAGIALIIVIMMDYLNRYNKNVW